MTPIFFFSSLYLLINLSLAIRYIQKFYQMRTQLQAISLRIQVRQLFEIWRISALTVTYRPSVAMNR
jgi:division protein CdvB (Snf7/Vps24/ESCRT-III family)